MAGEDLDIQEQEEEQEEEQESGGSKKASLLVIILAVMLIVAVGVVCFVLYPMYQEMTGGADSTAKAVVEEPEPKEIVVGKIFKIEGLTVNPKGSMGRRYVIFDIALEYCS